MPANTDPIYTTLGDVQWATLAAANTATDGTGTVATVFTADATNGGYIDRVVVQSSGSTVATRLSLFLNNGSTNATATNNSHIAQITLAASTSSNTAGAASYEVPLRLALPAGYKVNAIVATWSTGTWHLTGVGGKY
jgi:hypothetical protein